MKVIFDQLKTFADRLGLISVAEADSPKQPAKITTRTISLKDLTAEIRAAEVRALAELPAEMSVVFPKIYEAAGVKPGEHGWTIHRLSQLLGTEQFKAMDKAGIRLAVLGMLSADAAKIEDLAKHAVACDEALDAFEVFVRRKMDERIAARQRQADELRVRIQELEAQAVKLEEQTRGDEREWKQWLGRKRAEEDVMAEALMCLLDEPRITRNRT